MKSLRLTRITTEAEQGTFGALTIDGMPFCVTLEPSWAMNQKNISCIPTGRYLIKPHYSPTFGSTFMVQDVYGRNLVLFHPGNRDGDTEGCIVLASSYGKLYGDWAILNSGNTFKSFLKVMEGETNAELIITENY